jgi:DNA-binding winged helix-turn-helix (wHTH) protein
MNPRYSVKLGEFLLDPSIPVLMLGSSVVELPPKALDILVVLVRNAGRVVRNGDLLDLVWPDTAVEEGNIAVYISHLRRALGDNRRSQPAYIETVPKRGYRFAAAVQPLGPSALADDSGLAALGRLAVHYLDSFTIEGCQTAKVLLRRFIANSRDAAWARAMIAQTLLMQCLLGSANQERAVQEGLNLLNEAAEINPLCPYGVRVFVGNGTKQRKMPGKLWRQRPRHIRASSL